MSAGRAGDASSRSASRAGSRARSASAEGWRCAPCSRAPIPEMRRRSPRLPGTAWFLALRARALGQLLLGLCGHRLRLGRLYLPALELVAGLALRFLERVRLAEQFLEEPHASILSGGLAGKPSARTPPRLRPRVRRCREPSSL